MNNIDIEKIIAKILIYLVNILGALLFIYIYINKGEIKSKHTTFDMEKIEKGSDYNSDQIQAENIAIKILKRTKI